MNEKYIELALDAFAVAVKLIAELQAQGKLTDEQLDAFVLSQNAETRAQIQKYIAAVKSEVQG